MSLSKLTKTYHHDTYPAISPTKPSLSKAGQTILITGGSKGIGFEAARSFAKASASRVIIVGREIEELDKATAKLADEFKNKTKFIARQVDVGDEALIRALWEFLHSQNILVDVLVLNAAYLDPAGPDTLKLDMHQLMRSFEVNVGGNFLMSQSFVSQSPRPAGKRLYLVHLSSGAVQMYPTPYTPYAAAKGAFLAMLGRIALERPVEDVQVIIFHPGLIYTSPAQAHGPRTDAMKWDEIQLPADFAVWAASPEASWLHGRYLWAQWDVDELKADKDIVKRVESEPDFLKAGVLGLNSFSFEAYRSRARGFLKAWSRRATRWMEGLR